MISAESIRQARAWIEEIDFAEVEQLLYKEWLERDERRREREARRGRPRPINCFSCRRCFKSRPSSRCTRCGDEPVTRTTHMDATYDDRMRFDENYYGERVL